MYWRYFLEPGVVVQRANEIHLKGGENNIVTFEPAETKFRGFSPHANYTDRAAAACRRS
jgi:hypothetical protein